MKKILLSLIIIIGVFLTAKGQLPNYVPTNGLVGFWTFNGNANDVSGNGNNGIVTGALLTSDRNSKINSAYSFDGNGDYINCGNSPSVNITGSLTISAWVYANNLGGDHGILSKMNGGISTYELISSGNQFRWMDVGGFLFSNSIAPNQWVNVVSVFDSSSLLKSIYINGVLNNTLISSVSVIPTNLDNLYIGAHQPSIVPGWSWDGKLDDIGIWNRALTQTEISNLFYECKLSVIHQPNSQLISKDSSALFVVGSSVSNSLFQWQTDLGVGFQNLNNVGQYNGAKDDTLRISNVTMNNNNQSFRCIISSGSCTDTSNFAILTVNNNVGLNNFKTTKLNIHPNPTTNTLHIEGLEKTINNSAMIYSIQGLILKQINTIQNDEIDLSDFNPGVYLIKINDVAHRVVKL